MRKKWPIIIIIVTLITGIVIGCQKRSATKEEVYQDFEELNNDAFLNINQNNIEDIDFTKFDVNMIHSFITQNQKSEA